MSMDLPQQGSNSQNLALRYNLYLLAHYKTLKVRIDVEIYDINQHLSYYLYVTIFTIKCNQILQKSKCF